MKNGLLLLNKPRGITSNMAIQQVRRKLNIKKIGHSGTLDKLAQGLLVLGVNEGTKVLSDLILGSKKYTAQLYLGKYSRTDDEEGEKISGEKFYIPSQKELEKSLQKFRGEISQIPPQYSALKINGKRASDRVRNGEEVFLKARTIMITSLELISYEYPYAQISVSCSSGTYIRSLIRDIGKDLEVGAYMTSLSRDSVGEFCLSEAKSYEEIEEVDIIGILPQHLGTPFLDISITEYRNLLNGKKISTQKNSAEKYALFLDQSTFCGFAKVSEGEISPLRMMNIAI